jgi:glucose-6-phosphate isomerase
MLKFNFQKISQVPPNFLKQKPEISNYFKKLKEILKEKNFNFPESFLLLPEEKLAFLGKILRKFKLVILVGIGGSNLGTEAIFHALKNKKNLNEVLFLDTLNPLFLKKIALKLRLNNIKKGELAVCFISKSGKTFETNANFFVLFNFLKRYQPKIFVITEENSSLWKFAKNNNWFTLTVPKMVVGRYSVFSNVGLFPLYLAGINVRELLLGAKEANKICLVDNPLRNPALASALTIFYHWKKKKNIYSNFVFPPDLEFFGKWYCQLMAESLGKNKKGIMPVVNIGTNDFHSIIQLYFDGPRDKLINFVFAENLDFDFQLPRDENLNLLFPGSSGKKIWKISKTLFEGVKKVYLRKKLPFTETILPKLDERNLGALFQTKMIEILFLAKLMKVNAFTEPAVELYKKEVRKILKQKK